MAEVTELIEKAVQTSEEANDITALSETTSKAGETFRPAGVPAGAQICGRCTDEPPGNTTFRFMYVNTVDLNVPDAQVHGMCARASDDESISLCDDCVEDLVRRSIFRRYQWHCVQERTGWGGMVRLPIFRLWPRQGKTMAR